MTSSPSIARSSPAAPMRCTRCFYILDFLPAGNCPECGLSFDPLDPATVTRRPPFIWWTFWMPAFLFATVGGITLYLALIPFFGFTWATSVAAPFAIGGVVGYGSRTRAPGSIFLSIAAIIFCIFALVVGGMMGSLCGCVFAAVALLPAITGAAFGSVLKHILIAKNFSQRWYLRNSIKLLIFLLPLMIAISEGRHDDLASFSVSTSETIDASPTDVWRSVQFYEEVKRPVPWLLRISPSLRPIGTSGNSTHVGDLRVCRYERGHLAKLITEIVPNRRLAFTVVHQEQIENHSIVLLDGSFDLEATDDGKHTRLTLTTRYRPLLSPRFAYEWAELWTVRTLHRHVIDGMSEDAIARQ